MYGGADPCHPRFNAFRTSRYSPVSPYHAKSMKLKVGDLAPTFTLKDQNGTTHLLTDYRGRWVLLYFYPKDNTPGCTKEACGMRDAASRWTDMKTTVLGVSKDSESSHKKFQKKYDLNFPLLADEKFEVIKKYGVWAKKKFMGREYMGVMRVSFLVDPKGKIAKIYDKVKPQTHAQDVLDDLPEFGMEGRTH